MEIRRANPSQAAQLTAIALAAKRYWGYPERWIEIWRNVLTITPDYIETNAVFAGCLDADIAGFYALVRDDQAAVLDHLWLRPQYIGLGLGRELIEHARQQAAALQARIIEIESEPNAENFYLHMGARRVGEKRAILEGQERVLPLLVLDVS